MRFLFVDQITSFSSSTEAKGLKHVTYDDFYLTQHDEGPWSFTPSLIGETLGQLAAWHVMAQTDFNVRPVAGIAGVATFSQAVFPGQTLSLHTVIDVLDEAAVQYHGTASVEGHIVFSLEGALGPLLPMETFISKDEVKKQFNEIYRPQEKVQEIPRFARDDGFSARDNGGFHSPKMMFDRIIQHEAGLCIVAEKRVTRAAPYFADHFPNKPVLPMTVLLESFLNLAYFFIETGPWRQKYHCHQVRRVKMNDFIFPGDCVVGEVKLKTTTEMELILLCRAEVNGKRVGVFEIIMKERSA